MRIILKNIFLLLFLLAANTGRAQIISAYSFSPIMGSGSSMMNGGYSVELSGYLKCIQVTTGLNIFSIPDKNNGSFGSCCIVPAAIAIVTNNLLVYPNPTRGISIVKGVGKFEAGVSGQLRIMNADGRIMLTQVVDMISLQVGFAVNLTNYPTGLYLITITTSSGQASSKLIKL